MKIIMHIIEYKRDKLRKGKYKEHTSNPYFFFKFYLLFFSFFCLFFFLVSDSIEPLPGAESCSGAFSVLCFLFLLIL